MIMNFIDLHRILTEVILRVYGLICNWVLYLLIEKTILGLPIFVPGMEGKIFMVNFIRGFFEFSFYSHMGNGFNNLILFRPSSLNDIH